MSLASAKPAPARSKRRAIAAPSPGSEVSTPTKATLPSVASATWTNPGSSSLQYTHHEAKKFTTTGVPA